MLADLLLLFAYTARVEHTTTLYSRNHHKFYHQVYQFFHKASESPLSRWIFEYTSADRIRVLQHEQNYELVLTQFCNGSLRVVDIPDHTNVTGKCMVCNTYRNGCPTTDPGFADGRDSGHFMLASGLNCMTPSDCVDRGWLAKLEALFTKHSTHVSIFRK